MKTTEIRREHRPDLQHSIIGLEVSVFSGLVISLFIYITLLAQVLASAALQPLM